MVVYGSHGLRSGDAGTTYTQFPLVDQPRVDDDPGFRLRMSDAHHGSDSASSLAFIWLGAYKYRVLVRRSRI
jgi:hypothetical protein